MILTVNGSENPGCLHGLVIEDTATKAKKTYIYIETNRRCVNECVQTTENGASQIRVS